MEFLTKLAIENWEKQIMLIYAIVKLKIQILIVVSIKDLHLFYILPF